MLTIPQIEALRTENPHLYEALKRLAAASLGPNQGWSLDDQITDGSTYARVIADALTNGQIDLAKTGVIMRGSVPPAWSGAFTYVSTTSSIAWSWSALAILRADGTSTSVPNGTLSVNGLTAATTYYFYPYWDETSGALVFVAGGAGSPANALAAKTNVAAQQQALQGRVPLSQGAMVAATTSSGTGGGSGGGSGSCLRAGTMVLTKERGTVPIDSCKVGEHLRCPGAARGNIRRMRGGESEDASESWTRIVRLEVRDADTFIRLHFSNAEILDVTPHHIFTLADGSPMRAERLCLSDILVGRFGRVTLRRIETVTEHSPEGRHSERSGRMVSPSFPLAGTSGHAVEEPAVVVNVKAGTAGPSAASSGPEGPGQNKNALDSAQDDGSFGGAGGAGNDGRRAIGPREIDYKRMSDADILNL